MMKDSKPYSVPTKFITMIFFIVLLFVFTRCNDDDDDSAHVPVLEIKTITSGLVGVMGVETDGNGNIWVTESGTDVPDANNDTHNNNGKVILITPDGP